MEEKTEIKIGYIQIKDNKVVFIYHKLEKPDPNSTHYFDYATPELCIEFKIAMKEYEASKREVEVDNVTTIYEWPNEIDNPNDDKIFGYAFDLPKPDKQGNTAKMIKHNQPCEAEVNGKAVITKIL